MEEILQNKPQGISPTHVFQNFYHRKKAPVPVLEAVDLILLRRGSMLEDDDQMPKTAPQNGWVEVFLEV